MRRPGGPLLLLLALAGCRATIDEQGISNVPGEEVWETEVRLQLGETAYVDGQELQIRLDAVGIHNATILIQGDGPARRETLRAGLGGGLTVPPYEIELLSTAPDASATLSVRREVGP